jgi:TorA-specific chaperone
MEKPSTDAIWRWLAAIFAAPLDDDGLAACRANVASGIVAGDRALAAGVRGMGEALNALPPGAAGTARLARCYELLFSGVAGPATVAPYESAFATGGGRLFGEAEARMRTLLREIGVHVAGGPGEPADHVAVECAAMAELADDSARRADLACRLDGWLDNFRDACTAADDTKFYAGAAALAAALARQEAARFRPQ